MFYFYLQVFKERVRILEWLRDYDKLRSGRMVKSNFRRALDLCQFELTESELAIIEDQWVFLFCYVKYQKETNLSDI